MRLSRREADSLGIPIPGEAAKPRRRAAPKVASKGKWSDASAVSSWGVLSIWAPLPPSANRYWRHAVVKGRVCVYVSREAKAYRTALSSLVRGAGHRTFANPVRVRLKFCGRYDLDNVLKVLLDGLQGCAFTRDSLVESIEAVKIRGGGPGIEVQVSEVSA